MTRIGFAYNQKPELPVGPVNATTSESRPDEEPPSSSDVYAEWDSAETIAAVATALSAFGDVIPLEATEEFPERLRAARPDIVFNIAEGLHGANREAHVPAICEFLDVPYSGSDPFTLSLCLHKARTKDVLTTRGIPNAPFFLIESEAELDRLVGETRTFPLFLKPVQEGSSKGITERNFVRTRDELVSQARFLLDTYAQPVIAEEFLPGAEFTCGVLGNGASAEVLPIVAINFASLPSGAVPIYGYEAKWIWDTPSDPLDIFECPARSSRVACWVTDRPPKCCPSSRSISARCRPARFRSTATKRNGSGTRRAIRSTSSSAQRRSTVASNPRSKTSCSAHIARSAAAIGRGSTFASTPRAFRTSSRSIRFPEFFPTPKTTPVFQRPRALLVCLMTS